MKKGLYIILVILAIGGGYIAKSILTDRNKAELDRVAQIYLNGNVDTALIEINKYLDKYPKDDLAWTIKGNMLEDKDLDKDE